MVGTPHKATRTEYTMIIALITGTFIFIPAVLAGLAPLAIAGAICMSLAWGTGVSSTVPQAARAR